MKGLEPEDLLKFGLIPEFIGRLPMIATLEDLDEKIFNKNITRTKNSLTSNIKSCLNWMVLNLHLKKMH